MDIQKVLAKIDEINSKDPNIEQLDTKSYPKEVLYSRRMTEMLNEFVTSPSVSLQVASRGQHIQRWAIPRSDYSMNKKGYMKWRTVLKTYHAELLSDLLEGEGAEQSVVDQVRLLISKRKLKTDLESKTLEDVICLVFLKYYFAGFAKKHDEEKIIDIVRKTWAKMTEDGHTAALKLPFGDVELSLVKKALG
ncbi:MAG: hypothetical protein ACJA2S_001264 [Cyclobacteriaceae bacterium]|jgi:hypothetical protein